LDDLVTVRDDVTCRACLRSLPSHETADRLDCMYLLHSL